MASDKHRLMITIGAALAGTFESAVSGASSKIKGVGSAIKELENQSLVSGNALDKLKTRYNSLLASINDQKAIKQKRGYYRSQIMGMVALGASLAAPIKAAMDFQSALAGIKAVVNFPEPDGLKKLGDELSRISKEVPKTAEDLAKIAAVGGRFGVPLKELTKFTEEVAKTSVAWGMASGETAEYVGNLMKVFNLGTDQLVPHFDAINELGNKTGATADQILKSLNKAAGGLANFKIALPQAAALTSTLISFGETAETAGTQVTTMLNKLSIAPKLGAAAQQAFHKLGMSSKTLPQMIASDPQGTFDKFLAQLQKLDPTERSSVLYSIFGRGASASVGKLVENLDLYRKNLEFVANIDLYKGSRDGDYAIVLDTFQSKLTLLSNSTMDFARELGTTLIPAVSEVVTAITGVLNPMMEWMKENRETVGTITKIVAGALSLRLGLFALGYAFTFLFGWVAKIKTVFAGLRLVISLVGASFGALVSWPAVIGTALAGLAWLVFDNWDTVREYLKKMGDGIKEWWENCKGQTDEIIGSIEEKWDNFVSSAKILWSRGVNTFREVWGGTKDFLKTLFPEAMASGAAFFSNLSDKASEFYEDIEPLGSELVQPIKDAWGDLQKVLGDVFSGNLDSATNFFETIKNKASEVYEKAKSLGSELVQPIMDAWNRLKEFFSGLFSTVSAGIGKIMDSVKSIWGNIKGLFSGSNETEEEKVTPAVPSLKTIAPEGNRIQNNTFTITINVRDGENGQVIARQFMDNVSTGFGNLFLFDKGATAL